MLYSGLAGDDAPHEKGVTLILSKEAGKSLKDWEPISVHQSMHQRTMLKREWRTSTNSFSPPTARGRQEISPWSLVI